MRFFPRKSRSRRPQLSRRRLSCESLEARRLLAAEIEPNDTVATATSHVAGEILEGQLSRVTDIDYFSTQLTQGQRFTVDTFNVNAPRFSPTLPPGLEIYDADGSLIAASFDGRDLSITAASTGDYVIGIFANNAFGTFVGEYAMNSSITDAPTDSESEPNDAVADAGNVPLGRAFTGSLGSATDVDVFQLDATANGSVMVAFAGLAESNPAVTITNVAGDILGQTQSGLGIAIETSVDETVYITFSSDNAAGAVTGDYVAVVDRKSDARLASELGNGFDHAFASDANTLLGELDIAEDRDIYRFEVDAVQFLGFDLQFSWQEKIVDSGKEMRLFNDRGQILRFADNGYMSTEQTTALTPGTYYVEVFATAPVGLGVYALTANSNNGISLQRDHSVHFMDFDSDESYLGYDRVNAYAATEGIPYFMGLFDSRYKGFDVEVTRTKPIEGSEYVGSGIGDFGDIGAGGWGGGSHGYRASKGGTVNAAGETAIDQIRYYTSATVMHEFGHAVGLPHARDTQGLMSYVGNTEYLPVGDTYSFQGTDSRRPGNGLYNVRNYLDWSLQPGAQVYISEQMDSAEGTNLGPYLSEMTLDPKPVASYATGDRPIFSVSGDFNGDGRDDVAVSSDTTDQVDVFLSNPDGTFANPVVLSVGDAMLWYAETLTVGDFNADGNDDIAAIASDESRVVVFLSSGNGSFANGVTYALGNRPLGITTADVNNDGALDLVAATWSYAEVLLGSASGSFTVSDRFATDRNPHSIAAGDFNNDGHIDLATANGDVSTMTVLTGDGTGQFVRTDIDTAGGDGQSIVSEDFNGDGIADVVLGDHQASTLEVFLSVEGELVSQATIPLTQNPRFVRSADIDNDGNMDLLLSNYGRSLKVMLGTGDGQFTREISLEAGNSEAMASVGDFDNDDVNEIAVPNHRGANMVVLDSENVNDKNDRIVVYSAIDDRDDSDQFTLSVLAGERYWFDIDSAEFQYPLDATLQVLRADGTVLASSDDAMDRNSAIASVDPFIDITFSVSEQVTIVVSGSDASIGDYRFKVTPSRAMDDEGPQVLAVVPDNESVIESTSQLLFLMNDIVDPDSITGDNLTIVGAVSGPISGTAVVHPLESTIIWTADTPLPVDTYTITLNGDVGGVTDMVGNRLDGEIATDFQFPTISGDDTPGGSFVTHLTVDRVDTTPATINGVSYWRDPYNRGQFRLGLSSQLSVVDVHATEFTLRGVGPDGEFGTSDDTLQPLDAIYDTVNQVRNPTLFLYSRGVPDSGSYRIDGQVLDAAGHSITVAENILVSQAVPESALFTDSELTTPGITGSFVNTSLRSYSAQDDWRTTQTISGTRIDSQISFSTDTFGTRSDVGITGGADDENWDDFSVQWDGWVSIPQDGVQLFTRSDDSSRLWVDLNGDGTFDTTSELFDNHWGSGQGTTPGTPTGPLAAGAYQIRMQYEEGGGGNTAYLDWILPGQMIATDGFVHGPAITNLDLSSQSGTSSSVLDQIEITFSANVDLTTLSTENLVLRYSPNPDFFDDDDLFVEDNDGVIDWDPVHLVATMQFDSLPNGYYLFEANGDPGGITNEAGHLLDGEFLSSAIQGNTNSLLWKNTPSGNGIPGGDYRSTLTIGLPALEITTSATSFSENATSPSASLTVRRINADTTDPMIVTLTSSDTSELTLPATVTIAAGASSASVSLSAVDDRLLDGSQTVTITATAEHVSATETTLITDETNVFVTDHETLSVTIDAAEIRENAGVTNATVTRNNTDISEPLDVTLSISDPTEASVPNRVTIPANQSSFTFSLTGVDDDIIDGSVAISVAVDANGYIGDQAGLLVTDHESLSMTVDINSLSENGAFATATISRGQTNLNELISVSLVSSDLTEATVPTTVTIPANAPSATFLISSVDDVVLDGTKTVTITGTATGFTESTSVDVNVTDYETLSLTIDDEAVHEADGVATGTVRRMNIDLANELVVSLDSNLVSEATVPTTVTIPVGRSQATFTIRGVDDEVRDGTKSVVITATAGGYIDSSDSIDVLGNAAPVLDEIPDQTIDEESLLSLFITATDIDLPGDALLFSLDPGAPTGAAINADTGEFTWTPTETQGPGEFDVTVRVTDNGVLELDAAATFTITVNEHGKPPVLEPIGNRSVDERTRLLFTAAATDGDIPAGTLSYSLAADESGDVPAGATMDPNTGVFSWIPSEAQGPGVFTFDVVVSDGELTDSETIVVTVGEVNVAPSLDQIGNQTVDEGTLLAFTATTTDADLPGNAMTYRLAPNGSPEIPAGSSINETTGEFTWTPSEDQGPGIYKVDVIVSDGEFSDSETITITVGEVNVQPILDSIGDKTIDEETLLSFAVTATDTDVPSDNLEFSLSGDVPFGARIDKTTGEFSWTPNEAQGPASFTFDIQVGDGELSDSETITVTVDEVNQSPTLDEIGDKSVAELTSLLFKARASDGDTPENTLTFHLVENGSGNFPTGATLNETTGDFHWMPAEEQGPGTFVFDLVVSDGIATVAETVTITVAEVNAIPVLEEIGDRTLVENNLLSFTAVATDTDHPADVVTYHLAGTIPQGATIDETTGEFSWIPTNDQGPGTYTFDVVASDTTSSDSETITVHVGDTPRLSLSVDQTTISENGGRSRVTVGRNVGIADTLVVTIDSNQPGSATLPESVTLRSGQSSVSFFVTPVDNAIASGTTFNEITATADGFETDVITLQFEDDDHAEIEISQIDNNTIVSEQGSGDSFTMVLQSEPIADVLVAITVDSGDEVTIVTSTFQFTPLNWNIPQEVTIVGNPDLIDDGDQSLLLTMEITSDGEGNPYGSLDPIVLTITNLDHPVDQFEIVSEDGLFKVYDATTSGLVGEWIIIEGEPTEIVTGGLDDVIQVMPTETQSPLVVSSAAGDDTIAFSPLNVTAIDGGEGTDTAVVQGQGSILNLLEAKLTLTSIEQIDLRAVGSQLLVGSNASLRQVFGDDSVLAVWADSADAIDLGGPSEGWMLNTPTMNGDVVWHQIGGDRFTILLSNDLAWTNPMNPLDVDRSGEISAADALRVINRLSEKIPTLLPTPSEQSPVDSYFDVTGDGEATPLDALQVINFLSQTRVSGEGEPIGQWMIEGISSIENSDPIREAIASDLSSAQVKYGGFDHSSFDYPKEMEIADPSERLENQDQPSEASKFGLLDKAFSDWQ
ncbi:putative Ig domain protein [Planctomycetes bacterium CA13]|uniref:Putative Ig domain protein n=1 Tax=Novipirellula herctigrandis TaxID=2527986 RepID=A0A5C5YWA7_9BACT|nr:putative Ig domain protein [Planctomycetes bacterium CA13]